MRSCSRSVEFGLASSTLCDGTNVDSSTLGNSVDLETKSSIFLNLTLNGLALKRRKHRLLNIHGHGLAFLD